MNRTVVKGKLLNSLLIVTSLIGYLEWGGNNHTFLFRAEYELLSRLPQEPASALHPFIILPVAGQVLLLITLLQRRPGKALSYTGMAALGLLPGFMFLAGILSRNPAIIVSTLPFIVVALLTVRYYRRQKVPAKD